jgi:hypothetical protein
MFAVMPSPEVSLPGKRKVRKRPAVPSSKIFDTEKELMATVNSSAN